jgi:NADPH2:quinone reductase
MIAADRDDGIRHHEARHRERLAGGSIFSYVTETGELQQRAAIVIEAIRAGWLRVSDGAAFELDRVADAHRAIEGRGTHGKLYLTP